MPATNARQFVTNKHRGAEQSHPIRKGEGPIRNTYKPGYYCVENTTSGTYTDDNGKYSLHITPGKHTIIASFRYAQNSRKQ